MAEYIPFITSPKARDLVKKIYSDAQIARVPLDLAEKIALPPALKLWVDPGVDGLDDLEARRPRRDKRDPDKERKSAWYELMKDISGFEEIADPTFTAKPNPKVVQNFVAQLLDRCAKQTNDGWITVPQLPIVSDASRNKINRALAKATGDWTTSRRYSGKLILPLIFTHQNQINGKTQRNPKVAQAGRCYHEAHADGFWVVDSSLTDESGSKTLRNTRLPALIELHQELNDEISSRIRIAGPYWGMNLVLWARNLVDYPAIGVGASYQYFLAGGHAMAPSARAAIAPFRRRLFVQMIEPFNRWLEDAIGVLGPNHPSREELVEVQKYVAEMRKHRSLFSDPEVAREQVAKFYKDWFDLLASTPRGGRAVALFQDLSKAYALGKALHARAKSLPKQPQIPGWDMVRTPESVVEPLMLSCL
jgi:hypothetical protein